MTGSVINLNKFRKAREKEGARKQADENAVKFGRSKAERDLLDARMTKADKHLDDHKRDE